MDENTSFIKSPFAQWFLAITTIVSLAWAIYEHFHIANPKIVYEIQSKAVLFNRTEALSSVRLYVDSLDVSQSNQNISIYTFKVSNKGRASLSNAHYDDGAFGIKVSNGDIIKEPTVGDASNNHIIERYHDISPSSTLDFVEIPHIALDKEDWYSFSLAILHAYDSEPAFQPIGKIIGQKEIEGIKNIAVSSEELTFWESVFYGGFFSSLARFVFFFMLFLVVFFVFLIIISLIAEVIKMGILKKKKSIIATNPTIPGFVRDDFIDDHRRRILNVAWYYYSLGPDELNMSYDQAKKVVYDANQLGDKSFLLMRRIYLDIKRLIDEKYLSIDNSIITVPNTLKESVATIIKVWRLKNFYSPQKFTRLWYRRYMDEMSERAVNSIQKVKMSQNTWE